jgi:hypothetical protein
VGGLYCDLRHQIKDSGKLMKNVGRLCVSVVTGIYLLLNCVATSGLTRKVSSHFGVRPAGGT